MNYLNYIKDIFDNYESEYIVTEELNYQYNGIGNAVIIKYLAGTNYRDSIIQPIQLTVYTSDLVSTRTDLQSFANTYNNSPFYDPNTPTEYIQQIYSTPMLLTPFDPTGNNYTHQFIVSGTLLISSNVSEISKIEIDGEEIETTTRTLTYSSQIDSQRINTAYLNVSNVTYGSIQFSLQMINKNNTLSNKIRLLRQNSRDIDATFTIKLTFSDNLVTETYIMRLLSVALNSENQTLPILTLQFVL